MALEPPAERSTAAAQRLRMRRFFMAVATYSAVLLATPLIASVGVGSLFEGHFGLFVALAVLINLVFYLLFRSDLNLRFRDPSLTQAQILISAAWGMLALYNLPEARPVVLMFYVPPFSFGMLRLSRRQYFASVAIVLTLYAALLTSEYLTERPGFRSTNELLIFATFAMLLCWIAFFGGFVSDLRHKLGLQQRATQQAHDELQASLAQIRRLSGLLPICAACKKIRDDQGYWSQIETYIRSHSEAEFTHGICPDCAKRLYGHEAPAGS